jgi:putative membrane protein
MKALLATASVLALLATPVLAQTAPSRGTDRTTTAPRTTANEQLSKQDRDFARDAYKANLAEVEEGKVAQQRGANEGVKDLGKKLVDDHQAAGDKLKTIAQKNNIDLPSDAEQKAQKEAQKLGKKQGAEFDRDFSRHEAKEHGQAIKLFEKEAKNGKNPELKQYAEETLPKLREHQQMAQQLDTQLKGQKRTQTSSRAERGTAGTSTAPATGGTAPRQ